ncbi:MAG: hypothetical protein ACFFD1_14315 [Candidatus Thorarchaeota archaeon]
MIHIRNWLFFFILVATIVVIGQNTSALNSELVVYLEIPGQYERIYTGDNLIFNVEVLLLEENSNPERRDVMLEYVVKDNDGSVLTKISETKGLTLRMTDTKEIVLPEEIKPGIYTLEATVILEDSLSKSAENFEVQKKNALYYSYNEQVPVFYIIATLIFLGIVFLIFIYHLLYTIKCRR